MKNHVFFLLKKILKNPRGRFPPVLALFSILSVFLSSLTMVLTIGIMTGFQQELRKKILGFTPHLLVTRFDNSLMENWLELLNNIKSKFQENITFATPFLQTKALIKSSTSMDGGLLKGIWEDHQESILAENIIYGEYSLKRGEVLLGKEMAINLNVIPYDTIELITPLNPINTPLGKILSSKKVIVKGIFDSGIYDFNSTIIIANLEDVRELMGIEGKGVMGLEIYLKDPERVDYFEKNFFKITRDHALKLTTWKELNKTLFSALKLEKIAMFLILILMTIVASFTIASTLVIMINQKKREIGVLRSLGFTKIDLINLFTLLGLFLGIFGGSVGIISGLFLGLVISKSPLFRFPPDVYFIEYIPIRISLLDLVTIFIALLLIVFIASFLPARKIGNLSPMECLREE